MKKKFSNLSETSLIISLKKDNLPILAVLRKKKIIRENIPTSSFKKVRILVMTSLSPYHILRFEKNLKSRNIHMPITLKESYLKSFF